MFPLTVSGDVSLLYQEGREERLPGRRTCLLHVGGHVRGRAVAAEDAAQLAEGLPRSGFCLQE